MFRVVAAVIVASLVLTALALISCLSVEDRRRLRTLPRWAWVLVILLVPAFGSTAYFLAGRPHPEGGPQPGAWPLGGNPRPARPPAPDDDPDFLRSLNRPNASDEGLFRRWEEDLKRREDERRRQNGET